MMINGDHMMMVMYHDDDHDHTHKDFIRDEAEK